MKFIPFLLLAYLLSFSCERHDFENEQGTGTKQLNQPHPSHGASDDAGGQAH